MSCSACNNTIIDQDGLRCSNYYCNKVFHQHCASGELPVNDFWICDECRDHYHSPGYKSCSVSPRDAHVTQRIKPAGQQIIQYKYEDKTIISEIDRLREDISLMRQLLDRSISIIQTTCTKLELYTSKIDSLNNKLLDYETINSNMAEQLKRYMVLTEKIVHGDSTPLAQTNLRTYSDAVQPECSKNPNKDTKLSLILPPSRVRGPVTAHKSTSVLISQRRSAAVPVLTPAPVLASALAPATPVKSTCMPLSKYSRSIRSAEKSTSAANGTHDGDTQKVNRADALPATLWMEQKKKHRRPTSIRGTAGPSVTSLKAVEPRKHLHIWNMESNADEIRQYLRQLCPNGTCTVEELKAKGQYKSYKVGVPLAYYSTCLADNVWPTNARIKAWITFKTQHTAQPTLRDRQPFRGSAQSTQ